MLLLLLLLPVPVRTVNRRADLLDAPNVTHEQVPIQVRARPPSQVQLPGDAVALGIDRLQPPRRHPAGETSYYIIEGSIWASQQKSRRNISGWERGVNRSVSPGGAFSPTIRRAINLLHVQHKTFS